VWAVRSLDDVSLSWLVARAFLFHELWCILVLERAAISQEALNCTS
jgi:hypothetical protein